jgi:hypothetical protein
MRTLGKLGGKRIKRAKLETAVVVLFFLTPQLTFVQHEQANQSTVSAVSTSSFFALLVTARLGS